jgi:hypothetical protein
MTKLYWMGDKPSQCEICRGAIAHDFVDGATTRGPWAMMCMKCHHMFGFGLGQGVGQQYTLGDHDRWWKTGG